MDRAQKAEFVSQLNRNFNEVSVVVVTRNLGLTVAQSSDLRVKMRAAGASYKVSKNRLACKFAEPGVNAIGLSPDSRNRQRSSGSGSRPCSSKSGKPVSFVCRGQSGCGFANHSGNSPIT